MNPDRQPALDLIAGRTPRRTLVVAEIGVNHNGSLERAERLLREAAAAGADAAKLQLFDPSELCSRLHRSAERTMLESLRLSGAQHARLRDLAAELDLPLFATPFDEPSLTLLVALRIPVIKLGSGEVTHTPLLTAAARTGRPIILSTGGCTFAELDRAVAAVHAASPVPLSLLHCVSAYPPPDDQLNLRVIPALRERYPGCAVGYSDHTLGCEAALAAVALGARIIEKHLTLDRTDTGPDHAASADPRDFAELVRSVRRAETMLGTSEKRVQPCEGRIGRSIVAARDLYAGCLLTRADLAFKRPAGGLRPSEADGLVGRRLARNVACDDLITPADLVQSARPPGREPSILPARA